MSRPGKVLIAVVLAAGLFFAGYVARQPQTVGSTDSVKPVAVTYTCPMHPQYTSDRPGDCPLCGMRLEPVASAGSKGQPALPASDAVVVERASRELIGIRTDEVRLQSSSDVLRVPGRIAVDQQRLYRIIAAADGWIVRLGDNTVGRFVKQDQLLGAYYTKDLLSAERLFLLSIPANEPLPSLTKDFSQASIRTSGSANPQFPIDSLRGLGMDDLQIDEIHQSRTASPQVNIYSPAAGFVLERNVAPRQRFDKGAELYRIADITRVWVWTDIFEKDRQFLKPGAEATVVYQGRRLKARMSDALPQFDQQSRTLKTRFELDNPGNLLQPDMFVDVELDVRMPPAMTVPADAVFDSGRRKTVFVDLGNGRYEARRVETGWRLGDRVEVTRGLMGGERVVASANFLLDSESRMKAASAGILNPESDPVCGMEVDAKKAAAAGRTTTHDGHTHYFCSDECRKKFEAEPAKYVEREGHQPAPAPTSAMPATVRAGQTVAASAPVKDPVCGMEVDPKDPAVAARKVVYEGKAYYFCTDECRKNFENDPTAYVK